MIQKTKRWAGRVGRTAALILDFLRFGFVGLLSGSVGPTLHKFLPIPSASMSHIMAAWLVWAVTIFAILLKLCEGEMPITGRGR